MVRVRVRVKVRVARFWDDKRGSEGSDTGHAVAAETSSGQGPVAPQRCAGARVFTRMDVRYDKDYTGVG